MLKDYINYLTVNGKAKNTIKNYVGRIEYLLKKIPKEKLNEKKLVEFFLGLGKTASPSTVNGYRNAIRSYLKFSKKNIALPKSLDIGEKLPDTITEKYFEEEIIHVVEAVSHNILKTKAIFYFMFYTGISIGEIPLLQRKNIDLIQRIAKTYREKVKRERLFCFTKKVKDIISSYFEYEPETENAFNISYHGLMSTFRRLKQYFKDINLHPHLFRHSFATMYLSRGGDLASLSKLLGHKKVTTTMRYLGLNIDKIKEIYDKKIK